MTLSPAEKREAKQLLRIAANVCTVDELEVLSHDIAGFGRRTGAQATGLTESAYRHRLESAYAKIRKAKEEAA